jgi:hypothetical protein
MGMTWDWTVRPGDVLTILSALIVAAGLLYRRGHHDRAVEASDENLSLKFDSMAEKVSDVQKEMKKLGDIVAQLAVQETKINLLMKWYDEIRRGVGLIRSDDP